MKIKIDHKPIPKRKRQEIKASAPLKDRVIAALKEVYDPELPVNVYDLGLIYELDVNEQSEVNVVMTLTAPNCPVADQIVRDIEKAIVSTKGVVKASVQLVFDPPWTSDRMSDAAKLEAGIF